MGLTVKTTEILNCDGCGEVVPESNIKKEYVIVEQHLEKSWNLDHEWWTTDVYRYDYTYDCPKCNNRGWILGQKQSR